jgi:hypothetical protein
MIKIDVGCEVQAIDFPTKGSFPICRDACWIEVQCRCVAPTVETQLEKDDGKVVEAKTNEEECTDDGEDIL